MRKLQSTQVLKGLILLLVFVTPLLFTKATTESFEFPKTYFLYFISATLGLICFLKSPEIKFSKFDFLVGAYLLIFLASTIFSEHMHTSIWGYYSRFNDGLVNLFSVLVIYKVINLNYSEKLEKSLFIAIGASGTLVALFGLVEKLTNPEIERINSTLGQPNWTAAVLIISILINFYNLLHSKNPKNKKVYLIFSILGFFGFWLTYSLSATIAFFAATSLFVVYFYKNILENIPYFLAIIIACSLFMFLQSGIFGSKITDLISDTNRISYVEQQNENSANNAFLDTQSLPINEGVTVEDKNDLVSGKQNLVSDPWFIRYNTWKSSLELPFKSAKNFFIGTGPETFPYVFQWVRPQQLNYSSEWNFIINKPHNYIVESFVETGILGLLGYLTIFGWLFFKASKIYKVLLIAIFVTDFFGWQTVTIGMYLWVFAAMIVKSDTDKSQYQS